jgi:hypothetical protein
MEGKPTGFFDHLWKGNQQLFGIIYGKEMPTAFLK